VTFEVVLSHIRRRDFGVLSTVSNERKPHAVGVNYGVSKPSRDFVIYVMTRRHLQKARNIAQNPDVSLVIPLTRRLLWFVPPPHYSVARSRRDRGLDGRRGDRCLQALLDGPPNPGGVSSLSLLFNHRGSPWGRRAVGGRAHRSSLREDTDPEQNDAKDRESKHRVGGREGKRWPRGTPPPSTSVWPVAPVGRGLCGPAAVLVMEAADQGRLDDPALIEALHRSGLWGVLVQGEVCSGAVVVDEIVAQQATQVGRVEHDQMIKALAATSDLTLEPRAMVPRGPPERRRILSQRQQQSPE
jgi:Pyridoxamine 5'-phosphate oxidase